ncbi:hypothetical protein ACHQM5_021127 [Ranunculus cassubicifolius]
MAVRITFGFLLLALTTLLPYVLPNSRQAYIVHVRKNSKPSPLETEKWYQSMTSGDIIHRYNFALHGFATHLSNNEAELLRARDDVLGVYPNKVHQLTTTHTPHFLGLVSVDNIPKRLLKQSDHGSNIIIGVLDTGISPESPSFNDKGLPEIPSHWKGTCEGRNFTQDMCNKKLVGARFDEQITPRDQEGHGSHTSAIAAGHEVQHASVYGYASGVASGIASKARIAMYKVCWPDYGCDSVDVVAGYDKAIEDGVDVISFSVGNSHVEHYYDDPVAIAQFNAMKHNIFVAAAAGNSGPLSRTVCNIPPWITTVGASTIDRRFPASLILADGSVLLGESMYSSFSLPAKKLFPLAYDNSSALCLPSVNPKIVKGKIVICVSRGGTDALVGEVVKEAGGIGLIVAYMNDTNWNSNHVVHVLPTVLLNSSTTKHVAMYLASSKDPYGTIVSGGTELDVKPTPVVAAFSARGPNNESRFIMKPDLIAPGVNILAAWPGDVGPSGLRWDKRETVFNMLSGTSMACPHVAGVAALLKGAHPDWSPARIRSAMMTTSYTIDNEGNQLLDGATHSRATPYEYGSGHIDPENALDPGLVYDLTLDDYIEFLCASEYSHLEIMKISQMPIKCQHGVNPWDLNYPSIAIAINQSESHQVLVTRTVTHMNEEASNYTVVIENPTGIMVSVDPPTLEFSHRDQQLSYQVTIFAKKFKIPQGQSRTVFGEMTWVDGRHKVRMPIVVVVSNSEDQFTLSLPFLVCLCILHVLFISA